MTSRTCEIVAYVRSRRVVASAREVRGLLPCATGFAPPSAVPVRRLAVTYVRRLDDGQGRALAEAEQLAAQMRSEIRVVDLGRRNVLVRGLRLWLLGGRRLPVVVMKGSCPWNRLGDRASHGSVEARA